MLLFQEVFKKCFSQYFQILAQEVAEYHYDIIENKPEALSNRR